VSDARSDEHRMSGEFPHAEYFSDSEPGRKGEILAAALGVFSESGYSSGSMREIARRVGVSEPALYRHFAGKDALFLALVKAAGGRARQEGFKLIGELRPETLRAQLVALFADRRRAMPLYGPLLRTVLASASRDPRFLTEYRSSVVEPLRLRLTEKAAELDEAFGIADAEPTRDARVRALLALVVGYLLSSLVLGDEPEEAVADGVLNVMGWQQAAHGRPPGAAPSP